MTPNLRLALADWLAWAESDDWEMPSPDGIRYSVGFGLCHAVWKWGRLHGSSASDRAELSDDLETIFEREGLDPVYPFEGMNSSTYSGGPQNPARIAWVRKTLREKP